MSAGAFLTLFAGSGKRRLEDGWELRVVPAFAVLQARREALERSAQDDGALGLWMNACVLARALYKDGQRAFSDGEAVMQAASAEKIERWMRRCAGRIIRHAARKTRVLRRRRWGRRTMSGSSGACSSVSAFCRRRCARGA